MKCRTYISERFLITVYCCSMDDYAGVLLMVFPCYHATRIVGSIPHSSFVFHHNVYWRWLHRDSHYLSLVTFISFPCHVPISTSLSVMPHSTVLSIAISTRSSSHFTVRIAFLPIPKSPYTSRAYLVRYSLYYLNRIGDKEHPCLTPVPIFTRVHVRMYISGRHPILALTEGGCNDTCCYPLRNLCCFSGDKAAQACAPTNCVVFNHRYNCVSPDCDVLHCDSV